MCDNSLIRKRNYIIFGNSDLDKFLLKMWFNVVVELLMIICLVDENLCFGKF